MKNLLFQDSLTGHYRSFMLRLWREAPNAPYRASLQATTDGEQFTFPDLPALFTFLTEMDITNSGSQETTI